MKKYIVCFMAKSGSGKSTIIEKLLTENFSDLLHSVKSYSTREPRDEFDKLTHVFVEQDFYLKNQSKALLTYFNPEKNYFNWVDENSFSKDKMNLFAVDVNSYNELAKLKDYNVLGIFLDVDEEERKRRISKRGDDYLFEEWLDKSLIDKELIESKKCIIIDCNGSVEENAKLVSNEMRDMFRDFFEHMNKQ